jgi:hypothetical protein
MFPESMRTRDDFVAKMGEIYDCNQLEGGDTRVQPESGDKRKAECVET